MHYRVCHVVLHLQKLHYDEILRQPSGGCEDERKNEEETNTPNIFVSQNDLSCYTSSFLEHLCKNNQISDALDSF